MTTLPKFMGCGQKSGSPGASSLVAPSTWLRAGRRARAVDPAGGVDAGDFPRGDTLGRGLFGALERAEEGLFSMVRNSGGGFASSIWPLQRASGLPPLSNPCWDLITWQEMEPVPRAVTMSLVLSWLI